MLLKKMDGTTVTLEPTKIVAMLKKILGSLISDTEQQAIVRATEPQLFDGMTTSDMLSVLILNTTPLIEEDPVYDAVAARILRYKLHKETLTHLAPDHAHEERYHAAFPHAIRCGVAGGKLAPEMLSFDLDLLARTIKPERDELFAFMGLQTISDRYLLRASGKRIEMPQYFWMRIAMGLALAEQDKNARAIEFYHLMSTLRYVPGTPTLFHAGTTHPQLSSCYLTTIEDDLPHIFKCLGDNAQLSKWSGGVANDWTNIRATNSMIKSVGISSQGVVPFLRIANDVTAAISRSGSRRGATVAYLETWHLDIEDFLDLRKNTGDERRRTHDMNTANWIPDLFMKRVAADGEWTLFSPDDVSDLHHLYGKAFEARYQHYESLTHTGEITQFKRVSAQQLWRKMLTRLFETGHPWITFKDVCNIRSPQDHIGVVHSSNLCTEITLNTSAQETAVCNLGSVNLERHVTDGAINYHLLEETVSTAIRMLDNVVDINFYPTTEARHSNLQHRPIGLGVMGWQDMLFKLNLSFDDDAALSLADTLMENISYHAILSSSRLAKERGSYASFHGSKWDRGILPLDTIDLLEKERGMPITVNRESRKDWHVVRAHIRAHGMRNSNTMAIAPTATISNIAGSFPSIEPIYKNLYVKANMNGEFTVINHYLVEDLKACNLWSSEMRDKIKYYDGNIEYIEEIPQSIRHKHKEAFAIDPVRLLHMTALRGKWIDQSQSHNVFMRGVSGSLLNTIYTTAWHLGLKTTYYLRTLGASQVEKSTLDASKYGFTQKRVYTASTQSKSTSVPLDSTVAATSAGAACNINNQDCEACQ